MQAILPDILICQVVVNYSSSAAPAEEVAKTIEQSGGKALTIKADISKPDEVDRSAVESSFKFACTSLKRAATLCM